MIAGTEMISKPLDNQEINDLDHTIQLLGDKWKLRIIDALLKLDSLRFTSLQEYLGTVSPTVLTEQLRQLEGSGILIRNQEEGRSREYMLGPIGVRAAAIIHEMTKWGRDSRNINNSIEDISAETASCAMADFSSLKQLMTLKKLKKNEYLLKEGSVCNFIGFVEYGALRSFVTNNGEEMNNDFYLKNNVVCALTSFLSRRPTNCNIQALQDTEVVLVSYDRYQELIKYDVEWLSFAKMVSDSFFMRKCRRETSFLKHTTTEKLTMVKNMFPGINQIVPQYHIASYIGLRAESLSRFKLLSHQTK